MKKPYTIVIISLSSIFIIISCGKIAEKKNEKKQPLNPNGDSELAILMRTMMDSGKKMKNEIENNQPISPYPAEIKNMTTAKPTEGMIDDRNVFNGFANFHIATMDSVYLKGVNPKIQFNHLVTSCVNCHESYCHGPIPTIKQLYISSDRM